MDGDRKQRGLALTETDLVLFRWLWMLRVLTLGQLRRVGYYQSDTGNLSSFDNVRKRLRRLDEKGYVTGDILTETKERIYFLTEPALPALRGSCGIQQKRLYKPRGMETLRQIHHALMVSECAVRVLESIRESNLTLPNLPPLSSPFLHTHAVGNPRKKKHTERFVTQEDLRTSGGAQPLRIRPDLVFALAQGDTTRLYFLEADRGSESPREIAAKMLAYDRYVTYADPKEPSRLLWQRYGEVRDFRVLLVTTDDRRVANLTRSLQGKPGWELLSLATFDAVKENSMMFDPVWTNAYGEGRALARQL